MELTTGLISAVLSIVGALVGGYVGMSRRLTNTVSDMLSRRIMRLEDQLNQVQQQLAVLSSQTEQMQQNTNRVIDIALYGGGLPANDWLSRRKREDSNEQTG